MKTAARLIAQAAFIAALASCSFLDYSSMVPKKFALVYGVTRYILSLNSSAPSNPNLQFPDADARDFAALLQQNGYVVTSRWVDAAGTIYVNGVAVGTISDTSIDPRTPNKTTIESDIANLSAQVGPNDVFLLYFSGHGMQDASSTPAHEYFVPYGAIQLAPASTGGVDYFGFPGSSVRDDELGGLLSTSVQSPRKVMILDTCNSGGFIGNRLEVDATPQAQGAAHPPVLADAIANYASFQTSLTGMSPYNAQVISAAGRDELSYETASFGHGVMTYFLLQTGSQADLNRDGVVTVLEAFSYIKAGIEADWNKADPSAAFTPHVSGGPVDFVLF